MAIKKYTIGGVLINVGLAADRAALNVNQSSVRTRLQENLNVR